MTRSERKAIQYEIVVDNRSMRKGLGLPGVSIMGIAQQYANTTSERADLGQIKRMLVGLQEEVAKAGKKLIIVDDIPIAGGGFESVVDRRNEFKIPKSSGYTRPEFEPVRAKHPVRTGKTVRQMNYLANLG